MAAALLLVSACNAGARVIKIERAEGDFARQRHELHPRRLVLSHLPTPSEALTRDRADPIRAVDRANEMKAPAGGMPAGAVFLDTRGWSGGTRGWRASLEAP